MSVSTHTHFRRSPGRRETGQKGSREKQSTEFLQKTARYMGGTVRITTALQSGEKVPAENGRKMRKVVLFYCLFGWNDYFCKTGLG